MKLREVLKKHHVAVGTDNAFQQRARLLQALWREARGLPPGVRNTGAPLGSRLPLPLAKEQLSNFLTDNIRHAVRECMAAKLAGSGQLIAEERLYANLLSSQPLCFNMFGELQADLALATRVCAELWPARIGDVTAVRFEHSPGRGDMAYTADRSAFDVFVEHTLPSGGNGFIGIEVKYHENLKVGAAEFRPRYEEVARNMRCFAEEHLPSLRRSPLEQIWRDHLLAGAMLASGIWKSGLYVFLYPGGNIHCARAAASYDECLTSRESFDTLTRDRFVQVVEHHVRDAWVNELRERYLGW
ncbi:MAG TPA: hypothetical protein VHP33_17420, partial [Polyangiaceae bacterium]|nr:hypothetical protein [Polyangiaceae bacterium]